MKNIQVTASYVDELFSVFGFFQSTFTALERGESYSMSVGFKKGRTEAPAGLPFSVMVEFGTASKFKLYPIVFMDYII